jgi:cytochrome c553
MRAASLSRRTGLPWPSWPLLLLLAHAAVPAQPAAALKPEAVAACQACHGEKGISASATTPNLAGQKREYLALQLRAFKAGERKHELMSAIASQLSSAEITELAAYWSGLGPATSAVDTATASMLPPSKMGFPDGFPNGYTVYETVVDLDNGQLTRRYANRSAMQAARAGLPLPAGSAIVVANYAVLTDAATRQPVRDAAGLPLAGAIQSYAGMASREGWGTGIPALLRNADWNYALFASDGSPRAQINQATCLACHKPLAKDSFVFTLKALREAAAKWPG